MVGGVCGTGGRVSPYTFSTNMMMHDSHDDLVRHEHLHCSIVPKGSLDLQFARVLTLTTRVLDLKQVAA